MNDTTVSAITVEVKNGPKGVTLPQTIPVEAYERIEVVVPGVDPATKTQPGTATIVVLPPQTDAQFLLLTASPYSPGDTSLTYKPKDGKDEFILDQPLLLTGGGIKMLGNLQTLTITNNMGTGKDATITVLVGRKAVAATNQGGKGSQGGTGS